MERTTPVKGFKNFLMRGNLIDMAVAFIMGTAFATVVKSFTTIILDLLGKLGGTPNFSGWVPGGIHVGAFITDAIAFLIIAAVLYFGIVKPVEIANEHRKSGKLSEEEAPAPSSEDLLTEILSEGRGQRMHAKLWIEVDEGGRRELQMVRLGDKGGYDCGFALEDVRMFRDALSWLEDQAGQQYGNVADRGRLVGVEIDVW